MDKKKLLNISIGFAIAAVLVWLFFRGTDWAAVGEAMVSADLALLLLAFGFQFLSLIVKSWRWKLLLVSTAPEVSVLTCFKFFTIGFAANSLVPGRVGEVLRPYLLARDQDVKFMPTLASVLTERVIDMLVVFAMFSTVFILPEVMGANPDPASVSMLTTAGLATFGIALVLSAMLVLIRVQTELAVKLVRFFSKPLPAKIGDGLEKIIRTFAEGIGGLKGWQNITGLILSSFIGWTLGVLFFWLAFASFGLHAPWYFFFLLQAATALGVALPTPAGAGGFHMAVRLVAFSLWAMPMAAVQAAAISTHLIIFGSLTLIGVFFLITGGINIFSASAEAKDETE
jgi:uncharacterized protein (TIRG00374 family)